MADNIIQAIEKKLGIQSIQKMDPNTQDVKENVNSADKHTLDQAAVPAVLAGMYKFSLTDNGSNTVLNDSLSNWTNTLFADKYGDIVSHVAEYAGTSNEEAVQRMETIAQAAAGVIKSNASDANNPANVHQYLLSQRREILTYLPAELHLGDMLGDNTIDDRTNKMEGPLSSFMQKLGNIFNSTDKEPESKSHF